MKFKNQYSRRDKITPMKEGNETGLSLVFDEKKNKYVYIKEPSKTEPDLSLSPMEILQRFRMGLSTNNGKVPVYHGDIMIPDYSKMDYAELQTYRDKIKENLDVMKAELNLMEEADRKRQVEETMKKRKQFMEEMKEMIAGTPDGDRRSGADAGTSEGYLES